MTSIISFLGRSVRLLSHFCAYHAAPFGNPPCALRGLAREKEQGGRNDRGAGVKEREGEREGGRAGGTGVSATGSISS
jgi:hypothetical protein